LIIAKRPRRYVSTASEFEHSEILVGQQLAWQVCRTTDLHSAGFCICWILQNADFADAAECRILQIVQNAGFCKFCRMQDSVQILQNAGFCRKQDSAECRILQIPRKFCRMLDSADSAKCRMQDSANSAQILQNAGFCRFCRMQDSPDSAKCRQDSLKIMQGAGFCRILQNARREMLHFYTSAALGFQIVCSVCKSRPFGSAFGWEVFQTKPDCRILHDG
jgi:hypothetical protein